MAAYIANCRDDKAHDQQSVPGLYGGLTMVLPCSLPECAKRMGTKPPPFFISHPDAHRTGPPRPPCGLSPTRLADRDRRARCRARFEGDAGARDAALEAESGGWSARTARPRR